MRRLLLYDRGGNPLGELAEADVFEATLREEINGEHSLEITTTQVLEKGSRLLYQDGKSKWREFSVAGIDAEHASGNRAIGTYYCVWSVQEDLQGVTVSVMPGVQSPVTAGAALTSLLSTTNRWNKGTVTNTSTGGASMYDRSVWEALSTLVEVWGGEIDVSITVDTNTGVTARVVDLYSKQGEQTAKRRFDFGHDLQSVKRTYTDEPLYCRISPRGAGEETDAGGYGRKITIESVNSGKDYLEYAPMVSIARLPDGSGGYEYPTLIVENSNCKTPTDLKAWAQSILEESCTPKVSYEVDVFQAGIEGVDFNGVSLGDAVQIVDQKFSPEGIRVEGRISSITTDILNERDINVKIGSLEQSISAQFENVSKSLSQVDNYITVTSTAEYIDELLDRINTEINSTGGYTYIVQGHGIRTYDVEVSDPLIGSEASKVVEIKGGTIRIADSKTSQGEWEWKTVFTSGHISADLVTAANITTGFIGNANGNTYWDLDNNLIKIPTTTIVDNSTLGQMLTDAGAANAYVHPYGGGVLVGRTGNAVGALVNADGSFDVVQVTWSNGAPTVGVTYASYGNQQVMGIPSTGGYTVVDEGGIDVFARHITQTWNEAVLIARETDVSGYSQKLPYLTFGRRTGAIGGFSAVLGVGEASGMFYSAAINQGKATANDALAVNSGTAAGEYSFAACKGTYTGSDSQTALGRYNKKDTNNQYALIVGNGTADGRRDNAFTIDWSGNGVFAGNLTANGRFIGPMAYGTFFTHADRSLSPSWTYLEFTSFTGSGVNRNGWGIEIVTAGVYLVIGSCYCSTGFTANDIFHLAIWKNGSSACDTLTRMYSASPYQTVQASAVLKLSAGDVIALCVRNQTGERGTVTNRSNHGLMVIQIA